MIVRLHVSVSTALALLVPAILAAETGLPDSRIVHEAGEPIDVAEEFVRHALRKQYESAAALSTSTEDGVKNNRIVQQIHEDAKNQVYWNAADGHLVGDRAAVVFVRRPRDEAQKRSVESIHAIRVDGSWKVDLRPPTAPGTAASNESIRELRGWIERRSKEILSIVNAQTLPSYPVSGAWSTHHEQAHMVLVLSSDGQATIITIREGSYGSDVFDYHVQGEVIVIETRAGPVRLKRERQRPRSIDGQIYHSLVAEQPSPLKSMFPYETIRLKPVSRGASTVRRPSSLFEDRDFHGD